MANNQDKYSADNMANYRSAIALIYRIERENLLTSQDAKRLRKEISKKYGFDKDSIYAA